jgi:hypothetical protein
MFYIVSFYLIGCVFVALWLANKLNKQHPIMDFGDCLEIVIFDKSSYKHIGKSWYFFYWITK